MKQRLIERLHAVLRRARGDRLTNHIRLLFVDDVIAYERSGDEHFNRRHATRTLRGTNETHRDHSLQDSSELNTHRLLLVCWKRRNDTRDRFRRVECVKRGEYEVSGFGGS